MKVAIIADSHFDERSRFDECVRVHDWIASDALERGCEYWLHAGDVYERRSTPLERQAAIEWARKMTDVGPGVIVRGNHDAEVDLWPLGQIKATSRIHVVESAQTIELGYLTVHCLPWPRRANLLGDSKAASEQDIAEALRNVLRGLEPGLPGNARILLSHAMVRGSLTSHGQPLVGCDCELGLEDLALCQADFYALGHVHMPQDWTINGAPAVYPGSPRRTAFGEVETKGYLVVEFAHGRLVGWERIATPCAPMLLIEGNFDGVLEYEKPSDVSGAEIRLRYSVGADNRAAAKAAAEVERERLYDSGAVIVKIEEVVTVDTRARVPEVATATALEDQLRAYWDAQNGSGPTQAERARLVQKLHVLQGAQ